MIPRMSSESKKKWMEELKENRKLRDKSKKIPEKPTECVTKLFPGWNLISIPLDTGDSTVSDLVPSYLRSSLTPWYWYDPGPGGYVVVSDLPNNFTRSYWVSNETGDVITVLFRGIPVIRWTTSVHEGWNMTGSVLCRPCSNCYRDILEIFIPLLPEIGLVTTPPGFYSPPALRYLPITAQYVSSLSIYPTIGYWTRFLFQCALTLDFTEVKECQQVT